MTDIADLIGVRFRNHGRSKAEGFDCYGLAIEVSRRFGHTLKDLWYERSTEETFARNADSVIREMSAQVEATDRQEAGSLIIFFGLDGRMCHIGVLLGKNIFIHADESRVHISRLDRYFRRKWRIYRWLP